MEIRKYFKLNGSETPKLIDATEIQIKKNNPLHSPKWLKNSCLNNNTKYYQGCTATIRQTVLVVRDVNWYNHLGKLFGSIYYNMFILYDTIITLLLYLTEMSTHMCQKTYAGKFTAALFITTKKWTQHKCLLTVEWMNQLSGLFTQWNITQPLKKNEQLIHTDRWTWMNLADTMLTERR